MAIYPVGTPAQIVFPGQSSVAQWHWPADFPNSAGIPATHWTAPIAKPSGPNFWMSAYDIAWVSSNPTNPAFGFAECDSTGTTRAGGTNGMVIAANSGTTNLLLVPASVNWASTPYPAYAPHRTPTGTQPPTYTYSRADLPFIVCTGTWASGDSGGVAILSTSLAQVDGGVSMPWSGPYTVDCGAGPNRILLVQGWFYSTWGNPTVSNPALSGATLNGVGYNSTFTIAGGNLHPQNSNNQPSMQAFRFWFANPPVGTASLRFQWNLTDARGVCCAQAFAGVNQATPILQTDFTSATPASQTTSNTLTTAWSAPVGSWWISDLASFSNPNVTPGVAAQQFAVMTTQGLETMALQQAAASGAPVTVSWTLNSPQFTEICAVNLAWDGTTVQPTPTAIPSRLATIVG